MEPSDLNTHLPPRKRLLAGLRTAAAASSCDAAEPEPPMLLPEGLAARLRDMRPASTQQEIIEAAQRAFDAADAAAVAARAVAVDKAAVAARARAAARAAMEFLDSLSISGASRNGIQLLKAKSKKKHVQVKLLYRPPNGRGNDGREEAVGGDATPRPHRRRRESDEEVARKLHRAMNSSPRISFTGPKRTCGIAAGKDGFHSDGGGGGGDACNGSSTRTPTEVSGLVNGGSSVVKSGERTVQCSKIRAPDDDGEDYSQNTAKSSRHIVDNGVGIGNLCAARKVKIKRKQLFLNHHSNGEQREEHKEAEQNRDPIGYDELKSNGAEKRPSFTDVRPSGGDDPTPTKMTSVWKFKKFKPTLSHCSSDSKMLCSSSSAAETSASVKAD